MSNKTSSAIAVLTVVAGLVASPALAQSPVKMGQLDCVVNNVDKKLFKSELVLNCTYADVNGNNAGSYKGSIDRTGLDLGTIETTQFSWIVSTVGDDQNVKLDGTYVGAQAGASVGAGAGANWLTGGFNDKISLQPWSAEGKSGIGIALGSQKLVLTGM